MEFLVQMQWLYNAERYSQCRQIGYDQFLPMQQEEDIC